MLTTIVTRPTNGSRKTSVTRTVDTNDTELMETISKSDPYVQVVQGRFDTYVIDWREVIEGIKSLRST